MWPVTQEINYSWYPTGLEGSCRLRGHSCGLQHRDMCREPRFPGAIPYGSDPHFYGLVPNGTPTCDNVGMQSRLWPV